MANFNNNSRYARGTATTNRSGKTFLILRKPLNLQEDAGDILVTITQDIAMRPDLIADRAYGDASLWWAIYEFNGIRDPLFDLKPGQILRIPELERLLAAIKELED
jgi:hypothetical protein